MCAPDFGDKLAAVFDRHAPSTKRALAELEDPALRDRLERYARWRAPSLADGEDLLADAVERICDPEKSPWDPARGNLFGHLRRVVDDLAVDRARRGPSRFEVPKAQVISEDAIDPAPLADEALREREHGAWLVEVGRLLLAELREGDPVAARVYECALKGVEKPAEQAEALGLPVEQVYAAMRRIDRAAAHVRKKAEMERERARLARRAAWASRERRQERT